MTENRRIDENTIEAMAEWVERHSDPNRPFLLVGTKMYSPYQALDEVIAGSEHGIKLAESYIKRLEKQKAKRKPEDYKT